MRSSLFSGSITRRKVCHGAQYVICVGICQHNTLLTRNTSRPTRRATVWKSAPSSKATQMDGRTEKEETDLSVFEAHELTPRCTSFTPAVPRLSDSPILMEAACLCK